MMHAERSEQHMPRNLLDFDSCFFVAYEVESNDKVVDCHKNKTNMFNNRSVKRSVRVI